MDFSVSEDLLNGYIEKGRKLFEKKEEKAAAFKQDLKTVK